VTATTHRRPSVATQRRLGSVYCYDVRDHLTGFVHLADYIGRARDPQRRDQQHRGLAPQRDGVVRPQPWDDLIAGGMRILDQGWWTDDELDARERYWIGVLQPRLNYRDNEHNPDRIPIWLQRQQRDARDLAAGLTPRDWTRPTTPALPRSQPSRRVLSRLATSRPARWLWRTVGPWAAIWVVQWLVGVLWADWGAQDAAGAASLGLLAAIAGWRKLTRPKRRRRRR
jgi:hypothetical protein